MDQPDALAQTAANLSAVLSAVSQVDLPRASLKQRFFTALIDLFFFNLCVFVVTFVLAMVLAVFGAEDILRNIPNLLLSIIYFFIYYVAQESFGGRTMGKLIMGTKALSMDGAPLSFGQVLGRTAWRFMPFEGCSLIFGGDGELLAWHDRMPGTQVVSLTEA